MLISSWFNFSMFYIIKKFIPSLRFFNLVKYRFVKYFIMSLWHSLVSIPISLFSLSLLLIWWNSHTHTHTHHLCVFWLIWPSLSISWILLKNWFSVSLIPCIVYIAVTTSISTDLILKFEYFFLSTLLLSFLLVFLESD